MSVLSVGFFTGVVVYFRRPYGLGPVVGPVEIVRVLRVRVLAAEDHAVDEAADECDEPEYEEDYAQYPDKEWFEELQNDDEAQRHQDESKVEEQHEAAHALHVGAERVGGRHRVYFYTRLP